MNFNTISNQSYDRASTTYSYIWWDNLFTNEEIDKMSKYFTSQGTDTAKVSTTGVVNKKIRVSEVKFHTPTVDNHWPLSLERRRVEVGYGEILKFTPSVKIMINEK